MSSKLNILESKKLFKEFNYLVSDIEFKQEIAIECGPDFEKDIIKMLEEEPIIKQVCKDKFGKLLEKVEPKPIPTLSGEGINEGASENVKSSDCTGVVVYTGAKAPVKPMITLAENKEKLRHLFKKIVQKTHPDKINSDALKELYVKDVGANKAGDLLTIYAICNELSIKFNITDQ